jgi:hypothetical protein
MAELARYLPMGQRLDDAAFALRQRVNIASSIVVGAIVTTIGLVNYDVSHTLLELLPVAVALVVRARARAGTWPCCRWRWP